MTEIDGVQTLRLFASASQGLGLAALRQHIAAKVVALSDIRTQPGQHSSAFDGEPDSPEMREAAP